MPSSNQAVRTLVKVPFSEAAMHSRIAGLELTVIEEDLYMNGEEIPRAERNGCYVILPQGGRLPLLKIEAGWRD